MISKTYEIIIGKTSKLYLHSYITYSYYYYYLYFCSCCYIFIFRDSSQSSGVEDNFIFWNANIFFERRLKLKSSWSKTMIPTLFWSWLVTINPPTSHDNVSLAVVGFMKLGEDFVIMFHMVDKFSRSLMLYFDNYWSFTSLTIPCFLPFFLHFHFLGHCYHQELLIPYVLFNPYLFFLSFSTSLMIFPLYVN